MWLFAAKSVATSDRLDLIAVTLQLLFIGNSSQTWERANPTLFAKKIARSVTSEQLLLPAIAHKVANWETGDW